MVKARSGLGRGLNSLLGGGSEALPVEEEQTTAEEPIVQAESEMPAAVPAEPAPTAPEAEKTSQEQPQQANEAIREDNILIKGVVERPASAGRRPAAPQGDGDLTTDEVDIRRIYPNPDQPRTNFKKEELEELAQSIKRNGLLQPILVRRAQDDTYQIIAGERRYQACLMLNMETVPVRVRNVSDDETVTLALIENIQRSDLNPIEEAYGYRRMMERGKMTQSEVAQAVSKGRSTIANALRLLELPEDAQQLLFEEKITAGHARAILSIPTQDGRRKLTDKLVESQLSVRETEAIARLLAGKKEKEAKPHDPTPKSYKTVARALKDALETEVKIRSSQGKNKIEIEFKDETDLERLFRKITS